MKVILLSAATLPPPPAAAPPPPAHLLTTASKRKLVKHQIVHCSSGENGEVNGVSKGRLQMEFESNGNIDMHQDGLQSTDQASEKTQSNIWKLFKEAQRNIFYLNKQRLMAVEERNEIRRNQKLLLDKIKRLEVKGYAFSGEDLLSMSSELMLRIDSMVLTGTINSTEASALRSLVMDSKVSVSDYFSDFLHKRDVEILAELRLFSVERKMKGFHIFHICTEMAPVVSVGSLASYVTGLSQALQRKGNLVEVILPNIVYGIGVTFIQPIHYSSFFSSEKIYGYPNDFERFTYFSRASLDYIVKSGKQPDVLHIHNWETSIVGPLFWDVFVNQVGCIFSEASDVDLDSLKALIWIALNKGIQFIFMASNESQGINPELESFLENLKDESFRIMKKYDEALFHLIFAGSNIIWCSFDYPGLQLVLRAIKYGAAPVPVNADHRFRHLMDRDFKSTKLSEYISNTFASITLTQAIDEIKNHPVQWNRKIMDAMAKDFSWDAECCDIHVAAYASLKEQ